MQTILGAGGAIGHLLAKELTSYTTDIRLVGRNPKAVNKNDQLLQADLTNSTAIDGAVAGSEVVYVTIGFPYNIKTWQQNWPTFMRDVVDACIRHKSKLVFFDNVYMYDKTAIPQMTEDSPVNPPSAKGRVRAEVARIVLDAIESGHLTAVIARSADFYGPGIKNASVLTETVLNSLAAGKKATWLVDADRLHSYTFTPDAAKATAMLGNSEQADNQVWHLPTAADPWTGKQWIERAARLLGTKNKFQVAKPWAVKMMGFLVPIMGEVYEMLYQNDRDYYFDSSKFEKAFDFTPTGYAEGLQQIIDADYSRAT